MIAFKGGRFSASGKRSGLGSGFGSLVSYLKHGRADALPNPDRVAWVSYRNLAGIDNPTPEGKEDDLEATRAAVQKAAARTAS